jgi:hypothetical protein
MTDTAQSQINPLQQITYKKSDFDDESLTLLNQDMTNIRQALNNFLGFNGPTKFPAGIDMNGTRITNVGAAQHESDVVTQAFGNTKYGAAALAPSFEALGKKTLQTYRQLSNRDQRERYSSFLNQVLNTAPTSNTSNLTFGSVSGGTIPVTISSGFLQRVDGSSSPYAARTDTLSLPTSVVIVSLTRSGNIVTAVTATADGLSVDEGFSVQGAGDPSFDGAFSALTVTPPNTFTYFQGGSDASTTGGHLTVGGTYYYTISHGQSSLGLVAGVGADTWSERVAGSHDGTTIVAVISLNAGGINVVNSAAGSTAPVSGAAVPVIRRL